MWQTRGAAAGLVLATELGDVGVHDVGLAERLVLVPVQAVLGEQRGGDYMLLQTMV